MQEFKKEDREPSPSCVKIRPRTFLVGQDKPLAFEVEYSFVNKGKLEQSFLYVISRPKNKDAFPSHLFMTGDFLYGNLENKKAIIEEQIVQAEQWIERERELHRQFHSLPLPGEIQT